MATAPAMPAVSQNTVDRKHSNLAAAFVAFQRDVTNPKKNATGQIGNRSYKYSTLDQILEICRPLLTKHGLASLQVPHTDGLRVTIKTSLIHESGETLDFEPLSWDVKGGIQDLGVAITYLKRYALTSVLGIAAEEDTDGAATAPDRRNLQPVAAMPAAKAAAPVQNNNSDTSKIVAQSNPGEFMAGAKPFSFDLMVKEITALKDAVGEKFYYSTLRLSGVEHANQIKSKVEGVKIWKRLATVARILDMREILGEHDWIATLGRHGYEKAQDVVSDEERSAILSDMLAAAQAAGARR